MKLDTSTKNKVDFLTQTIERLEVLLERLKNLRAVYREDKYVNSASVKRASMEVSKSLTILRKSPYDWKVQE